MIADAVFFEVVSANFLRAIAAAYHRTSFAGDGFVLLLFFDFLQTGTQAQYQYAFDGQSGLSTHEAMTNTISRKTLSYLQEYDGSSTPVSETTTYSISEIDGTGTATITNPDGGVTTETQSLNRTVSIRHPDGTAVERIWRQNTPQGHPGMSSFDYYNYNVYDPQRINNYVKTEFTSIKDANGNPAKTAIKDYK